MPKSPANLSLSLSLSKKLAASIGVTSILYIFCSTQLSQQKMVRPLLLLRGRTRRIYLYVTLSIDFLRDVGNGVSPFLRVARTTHMHQLLKHNVQGQIPCIFLHSIPSNCEQRACCCCQCSPFSRTTQWDIDQGKLQGEKPRIYQEGFLELNKGKT